MTREQIKNEMIARIQTNLEDTLDELNICDLVDSDILTDFLWDKDYGKEIVDNYIDDHTDELVEGLLEEIYNEIDTDDLETPF